VTLASILGRLARVSVVKSTNHGWQGTMTKVGKSDREGTFAGKRGNDKVVP